MMVSRFTDAMRNADFVLIDGEVFSTGYLREPDERMVADDVVLEASQGEREVALTVDDVDGAEPVGDGAYRLRSGILVRFLCAVTVH